MSATPLVSVIIPTYNRAHIIERAIRSVLNQTYSNLEICVVDDASTDNTAEVVTAIHDPRLRYIRLTQNQGGGGARNVGIEATSGRYVAFLDSDDEWLPPMIERLLTYLMQADRRVGAVYCDYYVYDDVQQQISLTRSPMYTGREVYPQLLNGWTQALSTFLLRRCPLVAVGMFDPRLPRMQDYELWVRLSQICDFHAIDEPLVIKHEFASAQTSRNLTAINRALDIFMSQWQTMLHRDIGEAKTKRLRQIFLQYAYLAHAMTLSEHGQRWESFKTVVACRRATGPIPLKRLIRVMLPILFGYRVYFVALSFQSKLVRWRSGREAA